MKKGTIEQIKNKSKIIKFVGNSPMTSYEKNDIRDPVELFNKLKIEKILTDDEFKSNDNLDVAHLHGFEKAILNLVIKKDVDGVFVNIEDEFSLLNEVTHQITGSDCCYDIYINGITPKDCTSIDLKCDDIYLVSADWDSDKNMFVFKDFTYNNPLFETNMGSRLLIVIKDPININPKNIKCLYKHVFLRQSLHNFFLSENGPWAISKITSKNSYLFASHTFNPSRIIKDDNLEFVDDI